MKTTSIAIVCGAVLLGVFALRETATSQVPGSASGMRTPPVVEPHRIPQRGAVADAGPMDVRIYGKVVDVGPAELRVSGEGRELVVTVPDSASIFRDEQPAELQEIVAGDLADITAVRSGNQYLAFEVSATGLQ